MRFAAAFLFAALAGRAWALEGVDPNSWKEFKPAGEKFSVKMPGAPKTRSRKADTPAGQVTMHMAGIESETFAFNFTYADLPAAKIAGTGPEKILDEGREGALRNTKGAKLEAEIKIKLGDNPGRELHIDIPGDGKMVVRVILVKNRLYTLVVAGNDVRYDDKDVRTFVESLKFE